MRKLVFRSGDTLRLLNENYNYYNQSYFEIQSAVRENHYAWHGSCLDGSINRNYLHIERREDSMFPRKFFI